MRAPDPEPNPATVEGLSASTWIVIDRDSASNTFTVVHDGQPIFAIYVAVGTAGKVTPESLHTIIANFEVDDFRSDTLPDATIGYSYPNVPFAQYYADGGYALHGNYWHNDFGRPASQGCVNLTTTDAAYVYGLTRVGSTPVVIVN